jgi:bidirectional [NiFe] hydrogenase diaphorase subunit
MLIDASRAVPPTDDPRWGLVETRMRQLGNQPDALIETLHTVQETFGYIDDEALRYVGDRLSVPPSTALGVASFYHYFRRKPRGEHTAVICTGTACYIDGALEIVDSVQAEFGVVPGETTADGRLSLFTGRCFGSCSLAPAAIVDGDVRGHVVLRELLEQLKSL